MNIIKHTITFLFGIYVGQEYGKYIPNVKNKTMKYIVEIKSSDFYKKLEEDFIKPKKN